MSGILGCGNSRNNASVAASSPGVLAMAENGADCVLPVRWSTLTTWQAAHQRLASPSPLTTSPADAALSRIEIEKSTAKNLDMRPQRLGGIDLTGWFAGVRCYAAQ